MPRLWKALGLIALSIILPIATAQDYLRYNVSAIPLAALIGAIYLVYVIVSDQRFLAWHRAQKAANPYQQGILFMACVVATLLLLGFGGFGLYQLSSAHVTYLMQLDTGRLSATATPQPAESHFTTSSTRLKPKATHSPTLPPLPKATPVAPMVGVDTDASSSANRGHVPTPAVKSAMSPRSNASPPPGSINIGRQGNGNINNTGSNNTFVVPSLPTPPPQITTTEDPATQNDPNYPYLDTVVITSTVDIPYNLNLGIVFDANDSIDANAVKSWSDKMSSTMVERGGIAPGAILIKKTGERLPAIIVYYQTSVPPLGPENPITVVVQSKAPLHVRQLASGPPPQY